MTLVRYAGYDPNEHDFAGIQPAPLHSNDLRASGNQQIDVRAALQLRACGESWRRIGEILAAECNRPIKFTAEGVSGAVYRARKRMEGAL